MTTASFPRWTQIAAPIAALWYAFGLSQAIAGYMSDAAAAPVFVWIAYFLACIAGLIGAAALFFVPTRAFAVFAVSLVSAAVYYIWLFGFGAPLAEDYGIGAMVIGVTLMLTVLSRRFR